MAARGHGSRREHVGDRLVARRALLAEQRRCDALAAATQRLLAHVSSGGPEEREERRAALATAAGRLLAEFRAADDIAATSRRGAKGTSAR